MASVQPAARPSLLDCWAQLPVDSAESVRFIASALGYSQLTELQEAVFNAEGAFGERGLFVIGDTSSGKTLVPMLLYYQAVLAARVNGTPYPKMVFAVPYRALASQKQRELAEEVNALCSAFDLEPLNVMISTGEYRADDDAVRAGEADIAVVITEKVYRWCALDAGFLLRYDFLVLDEIGLVRDSSRGIKVDFILTWAHDALLDAALRATTPSSSSANTTLHGGTRSSSSRTTAKRYVACAARFTLPWFPRGSSTLRGMSMPVSNQSSTGVASTRKT